MHWSEIALNIGGALFVGGAGVAFVLLGIAMAFDTVKKD